MRKRALAGLLSISLLLLAVVGCSQQSGEPVQNQVSTKPRVYASFYVMYDFAEKIGKDRIDLVNLMPAGAEPHHWEPTPKTIAELQEADLLIYNGAGMEAWIDRIIPLLKDKVMLVDASKGIRLLESGQNLHHSEKHHEEGHDHGLYDPHVWLDPVLAKKQALNIKEALCQVDPDNKEFYEQNYNSFAQELDKLDADYKHALENAVRKEIVVTHAAFGYMAKRYNLKQTAIVGVTAESEPTAAKMAELVKYCKENNIKYIFFEELVSPKVAGVLAEEVGAKTLILHPLGNLTLQQHKAGNDYLSIMRENLENLKKALN